MRSAIAAIALCLVCLVVSAGEADYLREVEAALTKEMDGDSGATEKLPSAVAISPPATLDGPAQSDSLFPELRVRITARRHTILSSQSTGRIDEITVRDGDHFREGDILVRMDDASLRLQRARAEAFLGRQEVLYRLARELADMQSKGEAEVEVARMEVEQARAELAVVDLFLSRANVAAPFPGRVADVYAREKQYIPEGTPLLEILDDSTLELEFIVPSSWVRWFRPGFRFEVSIEETGRTYAAVLERLGGKVDPLSQSMKAYATLTRSDVDLMEGMSGSALIVPPDTAAE